MQDAQFSPSPEAGAAYAVAIEMVGGVFAVGDCSTREEYQRMRRILDGLLQWAATEGGATREAYAWGVSKVDADLQARLRVHEHSRNVQRALQTLPRPPKPEETKA